MIQIKRNIIVDLQLKDLDKKKGVVAFYFAPFGVYDSHNDIHEKSAFDRTFKEDKDRVLHLRNHDANEAPGVIIELGTDNKGAYAVSQLALKTIVGNDTFEQYDAGIIKQHSYGASKEKSKSKPDGKGGRILLDRDLYEVSSLTHWAASDKTPVISIKSLADIESVVEAMANINKALHSGNMSDKAYMQLDGEYKKLKMFLETKDDFVDALQLTKCWNCNQVIMHLNDDDNHATMVCPNCQKNTNMDGSQPEEYKKLNIAPAIERKGGPGSGRTANGGGVTGNGDGHIMGQTRSGKDVYSMKKANEYKNFTPADHHDAMALHKAAYKDSSPEMKDVHDKLFMAHQRAAIESKEFIVASDILEGIKFDLTAPTDRVKSILEGLNLQPKKKFSDAERKKLAASGVAMPDGSFPIENETDLTNAISDWGRAGSKPNVKDHIIKRAKALGLEKLIPADWK